MTLSHERIRHFLVWKVNDKLDRISVFDNDAEAVKAYEAAERALEPGEVCVLLGADRLATLLATHGNWLDEPIKLDPTDPWFGYMEMVTVPKQVLKMLYDCANSYDTRIPANGHDWWATPLRQMFDKEQADA